MIFIRPTPHIHYNMLKTKLCQVEIGADFTFFAIIAMFLALDTTGLALMSLAVCLIHEAGHLIAMVLTGQKPGAIVFRGGGVKIIANSTHSAHSTNSVHPAQSPFVLLAGSGLNIALFLSLYFTLPKTDIYPVMFAVLNLVIGVFNLLPVGCLDGKRLLGLFLPEKLLRVIETLALAAVVTAIIAAVVRGEVNFTIIAAIIYIIIVDFFGNLCYA